MAGVVSQHKNELHWDFFGWWDGIFLFCFDTLLSYWIFILIFFLTFFREREKTKDQEVNWVREMEKI